MKISVTIDYDNETKTAVVSIGGRSSKVWTDASFDLEKQIEDHVVDGWTIQEDTNYRTMTLTGKVSE